MTIPKEKEIVFSFLEKLKELNWFYFDNFQRNNNQEVLDRGKLSKQLQEINPFLTNIAIDRVIEKLLDPHLENQQFLNYLRSGITIYANGESYWVQLIDFQQPEKNKFRYLSSPYFPVCNQHGTRFYPDLVLFVNYLPLVVCEFKDWRRNDWKEDAYQEGSGGSIEKYSRELPQLFHFNVFNILSNGLDYLIGTTTKRSELFNYTPWRWEKCHHNIFSSTVLCDILENFLVFTKSKKKRIIRYHQYACLQEVSKVVSQQKIKEGIVAHTTGSGKSDTMVFLTKKLRQEYRQCTIIVITDRQELDLQLLDRFQDYEDVFFSPREFIFITSIRDLRENLTKPNLGKIIFVLIQKFQVQEFQELPTFSNSKGLFIFIDEYHRSQNLEIGKEDSLSWALEMRKSLPEAFLFGFTATPKEETFHNIIHSYSMDDALRDEVIVKIVYEIYQYLDLNKIKKNSLHPKGILPTLQVKGEFFKKDYENFSLNNQLNGQKPKVMYIAQSIPAAREFHQYLSQDPRFQKNVCLITSAQEKKEEENNINQFKNTPEVNIAIVVDKLTTGFNLESLQRIYLDQKINSPHRLFQKISRVNRKYPHKNWGFVIDLADNKEALEQTLAKYVRGSDGIIKTGPLELQPFWFKIENFLAEFSSRTELYQELFERQKIHDFDFTKKVLNYCYQKKEEERKEFYLETKNLWQILISRWYNQSETEKNDLEFIKWCFKLANTCRPQPPKPPRPPIIEPKNGDDPLIDNFDFAQVEVFIIPDHQINPLQTPFVYKNQQEERIRQMISEREDCGLLSEEWENKLITAQEEYQQGKINIKELNDYLTELAEMLTKSNEEIKQEIVKNIHYPLVRQIIQELSLDKDSNQEFVASVVNYFLQLNQAIPDWSQRKEKRREGRKEINEYAEKSFGEGLNQEKREKLIRIIENYFSSKYYLEKISFKQ